MQQQSVRFPHSIPILRFTPNYPCGIKGPLTSRGENGRSVPPSYPPRVTIPLVLPDGELPAPLQQGDSKEGWASKLARNSREGFDKLARSSQEMFKAIAGRFCGF